MRRTLISGLLLAAVAGCTVVNPKYPYDDRGNITYRPTMLPPGSFVSSPNGTPGAAPPTPLATPPASLPAAPVAAKSPAPGDGQSVVASKTGLPPDAPFQPAGCSDVQTEPDGMSARTVPHAPAPSSDASPPPAAVVSAPAMRMVNSKRFTLNYEIKDAGSDGPPPVDLWCTQDMRMWKKFDALPQGTHGYVVEVKDEGTYGFTLVARNGAGSRPPQAGDAPQVWVTVDATKPTVQMTGVELSLTSKLPSLIVRWSAQDKNFGPRPVTLSYAAQPEGPWTLIVQNAENTGRYEWPIPTSMPPTLFVRVEATDLVGNLGGAQTPTSIRMDPSWTGVLPPVAQTPKPAPKPVETMLPVAASIVNVEVGSPAKP